MRTGALLVSVTPLDAMAGGKESKIFEIFFLPENDFLEST